MTDLVDRVILPVASPDDARGTGRALQSHLDETSNVVAIHVIEKAGGAPDKAGVEQRKEYAEEVFDALRDSLPEEWAIETDIRFGTDVAEAIFAAADDHDASAIVITPRGGSRWLRLLTGDVALDVVTNSDRPVVVLPGASESTQTASDDSDTTDENEEGSGS